MPRLLPACKHCCNSQGANLNVLCTSKRVAWRQVDAVGEAGTLRSIRNRHRSAFSSHTTTSKSPVLLYCCRLHLVRTVVHSPLLVRHRADTVRKTSINPSRAHTTVSDGHDAEHGLQQNTDFPALPVCLRVCSASLAFCFKHSSGDQGLAGA
jgi:hypothetical protein